MDLIGPIGVQTPSKQNYILTIVDDYSGYCWAGLLHSKDEAMSTFENVYSRMRVETDQRINTIRCDQGGEFISNEFLRRCLQNGILLHLVPRYTPQLNGVVERYNRRIVEGVTAMLLSCSLARTYWGYAVETFVHVANRTYTKARNKAGVAHVSPYEVYHGKAPSYDHLRRWGSKVAYFIPKQARKDSFKFSSKVGFGHFLGYATGGYFVLTESRAIIVVPWDEVKFLTDNETLVSPERQAEIDALWNDIRDQSLGEPQTGGYGLGESTESTTLGERQGLEQCSNEHVNEIDGELSTSLEHLQQIQPGPNGRESTKLLTTREELEQSLENELSAQSVQDEGSESNQNVMITHEVDNLHDVDERVLSSESNYGSPVEEEEMSKLQESSKDSLEYELRDIKVSRRLRRLAKQLHIDMNGNTPMMSLLALVLQKNTVQQQKLDDTIIEYLIDDVLKDLANVEADECKVTSCFSSLVGMVQDMPKTPKSIKEAMVLPEWPLWKQAIADELASLIKNCTWKRMPLPKDKKALPCRWIFKIKLKSDGSIERYKARLVIQGFRQVKGVDYSETFAPVAKFNTIRLVIALAAYLNLEIHQMDVSTAFLNGLLEDEVYMKGPEGTEFEGQVLRLLRSLYGLKQAPKCWNSTLNKYLRKIGFRRCRADNCLYIRSSGGFLSLIVVYVDDLLIIDQDIEQINRIKKELSDQFDMKDLGETEHIVGIKVSRNRSKKLISLDQQSYLQRVLEKFGMDGCKSVSTPFVESADKQTHQAQADVNQYPYRAVVGSLMYLMVGTRPDIAFAVSQLSRDLEKPTAKSVVAANRVLRYLSGTRSYSLIYDGRSDLMPVAYADADYANDKLTRRSTTGYVIVMCGAAIIWKSKGQAQVALSSTEAEYYAAAAVCQEICWMQELMSEIYINVKSRGTLLNELQKSLEVIATHPMTLMEDNQSCIKICKNPEHFGRTKHIEVRYFFVRELTESGRVILQYVSTNDQLADLLTKPLPVGVTERLISGLGLRDSKSIENE